MYGKEYLDWRDEDLLRKRVNRLLARLPAEARAMVFQIVRDRDTTARAATWQQQNLMNQLGGVAHQYAPAPRYNTGPSFLQSIGLA